MEDFNIKQFLTENKMTRNSRLLSENMEGVEINGNTPIPVDAWKEYYQEFVEEIEGSMYAIKPEDQSFAKGTVEHMKTGIQNPPSTLDAAIEFIKKEQQLAGNGFGMMDEGGNPTQAILDIVILHNENPSTQFDADQLDDIEKYVDANYGNINEEEQLSLFPDDEPTEPTPEPLESNIEMVKDDYLARKEELDAMGSEKNQYAQQFAKWAKTKIKDIGFADRTMVSYELEKLFGMSKYSRFPFPDGRKENFLSVDVLEAWKSSNDPKYLGLLVYMDRILSPRKY
jgi:hypothetical protein